MGSTCCCMRVENFEDYMNWNGFLYRDCSCLNCFLQNFLHVYGSLFGREITTIPTSIQGAAALTTTSSSTDNSFSDVYRSPPRPLPYDADPRYFRLHRDGLVSRRDKGSSHSHEESEPLRRSDIDADSQSLITVGKWIECEDGLKEPCKSTVKLSSRKSGVDIACLYSSSEDEDVCPTCLEEYTPENPKIMTKCSHHFHLGCIYEWMERSENCPVCGKVMDFKESL